MVAGIEVLKEVPAWAMNLPDQVYDAERLLKEGGSRVPHTLRSVRGHRKALAGEADNHQVGLLHLLNTAACNQLDILEKVGVSPMNGLSTQLLGPNSGEAGQTALDHLSSLGLDLAGIDLPHFYATAH
jgi:hypothetical protein